MAPLSLLAGRTVYTFCLICLMTASSVYVSASPSCQKLCIFSLPFVLPWRTLELWPILKISMVFDKISENLNILCVSEYSHTIFLISILKRTDETSQGDFVTFPCGILGQMWYLIVLIPDLCRLSHFNCALAVTWLLLF